MIGCTTIARISPRWIRPSREAPGSLKTATPRYCPWRLPPGKADEKLMIKRPIESLNHQDVGKRGLARKTR